MPKMLVCAALAGAVALGAVGCAGGSKKTVDLGNGNKVSVGNKLPSTFPDDFPIYKGADLQGAVEGEQGGIKGTVATWTTGDALEKVRAYYNDAFSGDPWKQQATGAAGGASYWSTQNSKTGKVGYVSITGGDKVSIIAAVGDNPDQANAGASGTPAVDVTQTDASDASASPNTELPSEVSLPKDYPSSRVPLPPGSRVTLANQVSANGTQSYTIAFYTKDSGEQIATFYKDRLEANGFTQSLQTTAADGVYAAYAENPDGSGGIVTLAVSPGDVPGYQQVALQVTVQ